MITDSLIKDKKNIITEFLNSDIGSRKIILYGAGHCCLEALAAFDSCNIKVEYVCDDDFNKCGAKVEGHLIRRIEDVDISDDAIIIITSGFNAKMKDKLKMLGLYKYYVDLDFGRYEPNCENKDYFEKHQIQVEQAYELFTDDISKNLFVNLINYRISRNTGLLSGFEEDDQYFPKELLHLDDNEVFLDLGAYDGDSIRSFLRFTKGRYEKIIALEPNPQNFAKLSTNTNKIANIDIYNVGAYKESTELDFWMNGSKNSFFTDKGNAKVKVVAIDELLSQSKVTFIKMDIEGAEYDAILGCQKIISSNKPVMAISAYHKTSDLFELPILIKKINPDYKLFLRHYSPTMIETILYAIPENKLNIEL